MKRTFATATAVLALALAGCGGDDEEKASTGTGVAQDTNTGTTSEDAPAAGSGEATELKTDADPGGDLAFTETSLKAKPGEVTITMENPSSLPHGVGIRGNGVDTAGEVVEKGSTSTAKADLEPGTYEFYCPVPGHTEGGMKGELTVE